MNRHFRSCEIIRKMLRNRLVAMVAGSCHLTVLKNKFQTFLFFIQYKSYWCVKSSLARGSSLAELGDWCLNLDVSFTLNHAWCVDLSVRCLNLDVFIHPKCEWYLKIVLHSSEVWVILKSCSSFNTEVNDCVESSYILILR